VATVTSPAPLAEGVETENHRFLLEHNCGSDPDDLLNAVDERAA
jgi:hypothetical protein